MAKRSKKPADANRLGHAIVQEATDPDYDPYEGKDPAAVDQARLWGAKGGKARSEALTAEERSEAAQKAAQARWDQAHK